MPKTLLEVLHCLRLPKWCNIPWIAQFPTLIFYILAVYNISQFHWNFHTLSLFFYAKWPKSQGLFIFQFLLRHEWSRVSPSFAKLSTTWTNLYGLSFTENLILTNDYADLFTGPTFVQRFCLLTSEKDKFCEPSWFTRHANHNKEVK